jgi:hypothetical protein
LFLHRKSKTELRDERNCICAAGHHGAPAPNKAAAAPLMTLKGTVKAEDKYSFVNDKDGKSWDVMNAEELKRHEGHHVQLSAHVYADKNAIHVMSVTMLKGK